MASKDTVDTYLAAWNEADDAKRKQLLERCWSAGGTYTDPVADVAGPEALAAVIAQFQQQMPGASIQLGGGIDEHHGRLRFPWKLQMADGSTRITGIDVGEVTADGKLQSILGFWDAPAG